VRPPSCTLYSSLTTRRTESVPAWLRALPPDQRRVSVNLITSSKASCTARQIAYRVPNVGRPRCPIRGSLAVAARHLIVTKQTGSSGTFQRRHRTFYRRFKTSQKRPSAGNAQRRCCTKRVMARSPFDTAPPGRLSKRGWRALGIGALALIVIAGAAFAYLRFSTIPPTEQTAAAPTVDPRIATLYPVSYDFVTLSLGWAVANAFVSGATAGQWEVFRTIDGAKHWNVQLTGQSSGPGFTKISAQFFDLTHGFIVVSVPYAGDELYRTTDGGDHWKAVRLPAPESVMVMFSDASYGWTLAQANPQSGQLFNLYATTDSGATWQRLPDPPGDAYGLAFRGATETFMGSFGPSSPHVYTSADAGRSWQRHDLSPPPGQAWDVNGAGTSVQLLPKVGAVAMTHSGPTGGGAADFFTSFDAGGTWRYVPPPPGEVGYQDSFHWWAIRGSVLSKSSDAGQTWSQITSALPNWQFVPHVLDSEHAWAELTVVGGYGLAITSDGGMHWTRAAVPHL